MQLYAFSSSNLTNIWAGVGAGLWAVSKKVAENPGAITKARKMMIGSLGILYCSGTHEFTTPFVVKTIPQSDVVISHVWADEWGLPFDIAPLGSPSKRLSKNVVAK